MKMKKVWVSTRKNIAVMLALVFMVNIISVLSITYQANATDKTEVNTKEFDNGSKIKIDKLTKNQENNLFKLCKVWGFLKYYHPQVASGKFDWDYELFRIMPKVLNEGENKNVDLILCNWIEELGQFEEGNYKSENVKIPEDNGWIRDANFVSNELSSILLKIEKAKRINDNYYGVEDFSKACYSNEKEYKTFDYRYDSGYKLLALFRYWNLIQYYFPYKSIMDENWDNVLREFIPKFINSSDEIKYKLTICELVGKIQDGHGVLRIDTTFLNYFGKNILPVNLNLIENKLVVIEKLENLDTDSNIKIGDIILKINGEDSNKVIEDKLKYFPQTNKVVYRKIFFEALLRTNDEYLEVTIQRDKTISTEKIKCKEYFKTSFKREEGPCYSVIKNDIGYINPGTITYDDLPKVVEKLKDTKGLIVDLRYYPSYPIIHGIGDYLMKEKKPFAKFTEVNKYIPGQFIEVDEMPTIGVGNADNYKGKVIILINDRTKSQGEFTAMAFRCIPNATIIGSSSAGADGDALWISLPGNVKTAISSIGVYYPDGRETQRIGIIPDLEVKPTIEGLRCGKDELIEKAIQLINN